MAVNEDGDGVNFTQTDRKVLKEHGIYPSGLEEFIETMPSGLEEGDYFFDPSKNLSIREDMKDIIYSGLVSEYPTRKGVTLYVVTERGEKLLDEEDSFKSQGDFLEEIMPVELDNLMLSEPKKVDEVVGAQPYFDPLEAYKVISDEELDNSDLLASAELAGNAKWQKKDKKEAQDIEAPEIYVGIGEEMLGVWENIYAKMTLADNLTEEQENYRREIANKLDDIESELTDSRNGNKPDTYCITNCLHGLEERPYDFDY